VLLPIAKQRTLPKSAKQRTLPKRAKENKSAFLGKN